ncbi:hypothetical protein ACWEN6_28330 [Sphaerisporangium sp. NPDC004334]
MELVSAGAAAPSEKLAVPYPTRSPSRASWSAVQGAEPPLQARPSAERTSATLPAVPLSARPPVVSGDGSGALGVAPAASWTRW